MPYIHQSECLDGFAGSGSLGFEALSRQAKKVTFLELDKNCRQSIKKEFTNTQMLIRTG
ncbi:putative methyltransferase [Haemophilus influenzae]|uniref:Putative methyltransferase n=1 Tax=Haemophilus influenzae TaxID=727 RepID=A0A2X1PPX3_HAEIF|nr:putative methyltransferase [Haemophilus influenzae]